MPSHRLIPRVLAIAALGAATLAAPAAATTPGQNGRIAFSAVVADGSQQIFTVRTDGGGLRQVTHADGDSITPDWSPDGRRLTFEFDSPTACGIQIMRADGNDVRDLPGVPGSTCNGQPAFTADGRGVVFESFTEATNDDAIWSEDLSGAHLRRIAANATDPNVSPDGRRLSYVAFGAAELQQALVVDGLHGGAAREIVPFDKDVAIKHDWAPDGRRLVYTDNADNPDAAANLATVRADGTGVRYLTHYTDPEMRAYAGSYSPDGRWIVFRLEDHGLYSLARIRTDGTHLRTILKPSTFRPRFIDWGARPHRHEHGHARH
jgi:Tol biopolymer transport system component